jgi:hypothetical protein
MRAVPGFDPCVSAGGKPASGVSLEEEVRGTWHTCTVWYNFSVWWLIQWGDSVFDAV